MTNADAILPTGIAGLDLVLGGGVTHPALVVIIGNPGAGKTILASQVIFNAAHRGTKTLVFTTFSEGNTQYIQHLETLAFFDEAALGDTVQLFTLASVMTDEDTSPAAAIARTIRMAGAKLVLLDGFQGATSLGLGEHALSSATTTCLGTSVRDLAMLVLSL